MLNVIPGNIWAGFSGCIQKSNNKLLALVSFRYSGKKIFTVAHRETTLLKTLCLQRVKIFTEASLLFLSQRWMMQEEELKTLRHLSACYVTVFCSACFCWFVSIRSFNGCFYPLQAWRLQFSLCCDVCYVSMPGKWLVVTSSICVLYWMSSSMHACRHFEKEIIDLNLLHAMISACRVVYWK